MRVHLLVCAVLIGCGTDAADLPLGLEDLPPHFPVPNIPEENPYTTASVELGRHLFYDTRLSSNGTICSSCHDPDYAFADPRPVSLGATGDAGTLNAPSLGATLYLQPLTWARGDVSTIEDQLRGPMFGQSPIEMGMTGHEEEILSRLAAEPTYTDLFAAAFPDAAGAQNLDSARLALASLVRSLVSYSSPFDEFLTGNRSAISPAAQRGSELFYSQRLGCGGCHSGFAFSVAARGIDARNDLAPAHHNIGLYNLDGLGAYPAIAPGLISSTGIDRDMGRFRVPSLRNVAVTAPYMHDGSVATLEDVLRIYEEGGRVIDDGPLAGDGTNSPLRSDQIPQFTLTNAERVDLIEFLESLTDTALITDPAHRSPW